MAVTIRAVVSLALAALFIVTLVTGAILFVEKFVLADPGRGRGLGAGGYLGALHAYAAIGMGVLGLVHMGLNWRCLASYVRSLGRSSR
ncbi:MAG: DUF4405 domain-containing protein [Crenarchaeota archaeon]|nr:DUF4405 domain-containing protein [Thermoproteota archaeon]